MHVQVLSRSFFRLQPEADGPEVFGGSDLVWTPRLRCKPTSIQTHVVTGIGGRRTRGRREECRFPTRPVPQTGEFPLCVEIVQDLRLDRDVILHTWNLLCKLKKNTKPKGYTFCSSGQQWLQENFKVFIYDTDEAYNTPSNSEGHTHSDVLKIIFFTTFFLRLLFLFLCLCLKQGSYITDTSEFTCNPLTYRF